MPFVFALVVGVVFAPLSDFFERVSAPPVVGALAVLAIVLTTILARIYLFYPVVAEFILRVPFMWQELQQSLSGLKSTMENVENVQNRVAETLAPDGASDVDASAQVDIPTVPQLLSYVPSIAAQVLIFVGILYFFLLTRGEIYQWAHSCASSNLKASILKRAEVEVSRYFLAITAINAIFGVLVSLMLSAYGMPNAVYWGVGAFLLNYVLYLGPITFAGLLLMGGLVVFDGPLSFLPAITYLLMNMTEGQFVTPSLVGRQMSVNPLLIFVSLVFWLWMWGPLGGVIAIPLLVWVRQVYKATNAEREHGTGAKPRSTYNMVPEHQYGPAE
jgi:predicted PurR-regulated permease PerM